METLIQLINGMSAQVFSVVLQVVLIGSIAYYLKDLTTRLVNYLKMRSSDFGRGSKVEFAGKIGYITKISFNQVEIRLDDESLMLVPIARFLTTPKILYTKIPQHRD